MKSPSVISAFVCEDIRQEATGKFSLAGVFGSGINVPTIPAQMILGVFAEIKFHETGKFSPQFRVIDAGDHASIVGNMQITITNIRTGVPLTLGPFPINLTKQGILKFQWKFGSSSWLLVKAVEIFHVPGATAPTNPVSNVPAPPS